MHGVFNIIGELPEVVGLNSYEIFAMTIVANVETKRNVVGCCNNESSDLLDGIERNELVGFYKFVVCSLIVIDQPFLEAIFQAKKEFDGVAKVLSYGGVAQGRRGFREIVFRNLR